MEQQKVSAAQTEVNFYKGQFDDLQVNIVSKNDQINDLRNEALEQKKKQFEDNTVFEKQRNEQRYIIETLTAAN